MDENKFIQTILVGLITLVVGVLLEKAVAYHNNLCKKGKDFTKHSKEITFFLLGVFMNLLPDGVHLVRNNLKW